VSVRDRDSAGGVQVDEKHRGRLRLYIFFSKYAPTKSSITPFSALQPLNFCIPLSCELPYPHKKSGHCSGLEVTVNYTNSLFIWRALVEQISVMKYQLKRQHLWLIQPCIPHFTIVENCQWVKCRIILH